MGVGRETTARRLRAGSWLQAYLEDPEMLCSLDRIDSNGHYERGNLQIVCRFVNRWSDSVDAHFRTLVAKVRGLGPDDPFEEETSQ